MENILKCNSQVKKCINDSIKAYRKGDLYHYVYLHSIAGQVFYVGQGSHDRAIRIYGRSKKWYETAFNNKITVTIVTSLISKQESLEIERNLINQYTNCINQKVRISDKILCFTRNGIQLKEYDSFKHLEQEGFHPSCVGACCNKNRGLHKNYVWMYKQDYEKNGFSYKQAVCHPKIIIQETLKGKVIRELLTAQAFVQYGFNPKNIQQVCKGDKKSHKGYVFKYK